MQLDLSKQKVPVFDRPYNLNVHRVCGSHARC